MGKANTPPAQASLEWAQAAHPLSLPTLETHSISVGRSSLQTRTGTARGPLVQALGRGQAPLPPAPAVAASETTKSPVR